MNNILITGFRVGIIMIGIFFAFAQDVFAAPSLVPVFAQNTSETATVLTATYTDPAAHSGDFATVWFEWGNTPDPTRMAVVDSHNIFVGATFTRRLDGLNPNTMYYFRAAVMSGAAVTYSPIQSFVTKGGGQTVDVRTVNTNTTNINTVTSSTYTNTDTVNTANVSQSNTASAKKVTSTAPKTTGSTNANTAVVFGAGSSMLPGTLIGWVALMIALLTVVLLVHMIIESQDRRKKRRVLPKQETDEMKK